MMRLIQIIARVDDHCCILRVTLIFFICIVFRTLAICISHIFILGLSLFTNTLTALQVEGGHFCLRVYRKGTE